MSKIISVIICGARGKMGQRLVALTRADPELKLAGEIDIGDNLQTAIDQTQVVISFATPRASLEHTRISAQGGRAIVIGTTGLSPTDLTELKRLSAATPVLLSPNMSGGVNVMWKLAEEAARALSAANLKIIEVHHTEKKDAPSGTAIRLAQAIADVRGIDWKEIPIESIRQGGVVGDHTVTFEMPGETLQITHRAASRDIFAYGALQAAKWIANRAPGLYSMEDILGLK